eukprot:322980-Rhodomonas_salina.1
MGIKLLQPQPVAKIRTLSSCSLASCRIELQLIFVPENKLQLARDSDLAAQATVTVTLTPLQSGC